MTTLNFGKVTKYIEDRGFGFIGTTIKFQSRALITNNSVFFHIKNAKKYEGLLTSQMDAYFWYTTESTAKGKSVKNMWLRLDDVPAELRDSNEEFIQMVKDAREVEKAKAEAAKREADEYCKKKQDQNAEFEKLMEEVSSLNFSYSSQLSAYITSNKTGNKYPLLTGILTMHNGDDSWNFEGGIHPSFYRKVCERLGLSNNGSRARPGQFRSYSELR